MYGPRKFTEPINQISSSVGYFFLQKLDFKMHVGDGDIGNDPTGRIDHS